MSVVPSPAHTHPGVDLDSMTSFAEQHPDPVLYFDAQGHLLYANPAATRMAKSCGRGSPADLVLPEAAGLLGGTETPPRDRVRLETTTGGRRFSWLFFRGQPPAVVHCHGQDITERQQLEAQWRHAQKIESV